MQDMVAPPPTEAGVSSTRAAVSGLSAMFLSRALVGIAASGLLAGAIFAFGAKPDWAHWTWSAAIVPVLLALAAEIAAKLGRGIGLDVIAALAMVSALGLGEPLAGNIVALMYSGGQLLEAFAQGRARREMTALLGRVRRTAMRYGPAGVEEVAIEALVAGDRILLRMGEVLPVDGTIESGDATIDESALTGESIPVHFQTGDSAMSGATNVGSSFDLRVTHPSAESTYAGIVRLVDDAQRAKAPMARLADRYALWFLGLTIVVAGGAWWMTGDGVRALAVLVVATPCPLILAIPVAIISGISRCAHHGVLVKGGGALEMMARISTIILDKTGTLTDGRAKLVSIQSHGEITDSELLRLAGTLDLASNHVMATALVSAARERGIELGIPSNVKELPGTGVEGTVEHRHVILGAGGYVRQQIGHTPDQEITVPAGAVAVSVAVDGRMAGVLIFADAVRPEAERALRQFRALGIGRMILASGDRSDVTQAAGARLDFDEIHGDLKPSGKVAIIVSAQDRGAVMMVGDGVNDAPALAAADLGVALGARGSAAASETADIVVLVDRIDGLAEAMRIAKGAWRIALQSAFVGIGLSSIAMGFAAFGYLSPVQGALLQEAIDVGVILNGLRALRL